MVAPAENHNATLLIVDDDAASRERLREIFETAQYRVVTATEAASALRVLKGVRCDLVALDLEMPGVDGLALCKLLRAQPTTSKLPIIALSESDDETRKVQAFTAGADDYITKPSTPGELLSRVSLHVRTSQREWALIGSNRELRFLSDIGRGLLRALEPEQLVRRVAGATYEAIDGSLCAAYVVGRDKDALCVFDREGSADDQTLLNTTELQEWLQSGESVNSLLITDKSAFLLRDDLHAAEYVSPFRFAGRSKGALVVAFDLREQCGETERRLVDAAAQQTSLAAHICSLYQAARDQSVSLAREVEKRTAEIEAQRRFIEAIVDSLPLSLYAIDREYRVVAWNRNRELGELGIPRGSVLGKNVFNVLTRQPRDVLEEEFARVFESGEIERIDQETPSAKGDIRHWVISKIPMWADNSGQVTHVITVGEEVTDRVEANRAIARAEKLAAVGRLAAGVVHEINNPLATISACAESLEARVHEGAFDGSPARDDLAEYLGLIRSEAFRCKSITMGLLDFSRTRNAAHVTINLADVIRSAVRLLSHQKRSPQVDFKIDLALDLLPVSGDPGQLQQAIIVLATNALDAMGDSGVLTIVGRNEDDKVVVEVSDTGIGIPPENLPKIFEPFFTTKEIGRGTGLGLAVCYGILTEHGGTLDVQSTVGAGTTFTITLSAVKLSEEQTV